MESFIFTVRREDVVILKDALNQWGVNNKEHVTLAFDSSSPSDFVQLLIDGLTSPAAMNCFAASIGYFLARNKGKKVKVRKKDGSEFIVEGFSHDDTESPRV
ncbi:hypothetical protein, partial [Klebsiella pneumoniae]|uniref:hypothetical protein n=1 Tax=Klebsiella pneumoniae TaxID=573 RepID=UPI000CB1C7A3